ncbi:hypothetical protein, partial [Nostoc sp.]|uniref:hypothetical protein n=1 Tax=Nostoc sp. TaxID=1180 RepID=UPI002FF2352B
PENRLFFVGEKTGTSRGRSRTIRSCVGKIIINCNLIAVITGYMGHDLSQIVSDLKKDGTLTGDVFFLACRGKSGVVRAILNKVQ